MMTFAEWVGLLASVASLGAIAAAITAVVKRLTGLEGVKIKLLSALLAAAVNVVATLALPYLAELPPVVEQFWPVLVWIVSQVWYEAEWVVRGRAKAEADW